MNLLTELHVDRAEPTPLYRQLDRRLRQLIATGELQPEDCLPGDMELSQALGINNRTVRQGLQGLVEDGLIRRVRRAGTFVTAKAGRIQQRVAFLYFAEDARRMEICLSHMRRVFLRHHILVEPIAFVHDFYQREDVGERLRQEGLTGAILTPLADDACRRQLTELERSGFPLVRFNNAYFANQLTSPMVVGDWGRATRDAMEYLWSFGHRRIGLVNRATHRPVESAYDAFCEQHDAVQQSWKLRLDYDGSLEDLHALPLDELLTDHLQRHPELTALVCPVGAEQAAQAAAKLGLQVPTELSLLSWGRGQIGRDIPLTHLTIATRPLAEAAALHLITLLQHQSPLDTITRTPFDLVEGDSVTVPALPAVV